MYSLFFISITAVKCSVLISFLGISVQLHHLIYSIRTTTTTATTTTTTTTTTNTTTTTTTTTIRLPF